MKRLMLFWRLLTTKQSPDLVQNACRFRPLKAWKHSRQVNGVQVSTVYQCSLCNGSGNVYGDTCPRCYGEKEIVALNPLIFQNLSPTSQDET